MQSVRPEALTDAEFADLLYKSFGNTPTLPPEIQKELVIRVTKGGRDAEKEANRNNPDQLSLF